MRKFWLDPHTSQPRESLKVSLLCTKLACRSLLHYHFIGCSPRDLWNLPAAEANFLLDVSSLDDAAQYPSCDDSSVGSAVLVNTTLNTATVAYYTGTTPGSRACFVCDESSGYGLNGTTTNERVCQSDGVWSCRKSHCVWHVIAEMCVDVWQTETMKLQYMFCGCCPRYLG